MSDSRNRNKRRFKKSRPGDVRLSRPGDVRPAYQPSVPKNYGKTKH